MDHGGTGKTTFYGEAVEESFEKESIVVLRECIALQVKKSQDYQNPKSNVKQSDHYRRGVDTIHDMIAQKLLRAQSLIESGDVPNHESLEDTYKDAINYLSFAVAYLRGKMEGQDGTRDVFNRRKLEKIALGPTINLRPKGSL